MIVDTEGKQNNKYFTSTLQFQTTSSTAVSKLTMSTENMETNPVAILLLSATDYYRHYKFECNSNGMGCNRSTTQVLLAGK
jgi:hypothetical protein